MAAIPALIEGGFGFLSGLFDTSAEDQSKAYIESAKLGSRKAYPGQKSIATVLAPYLWENLDTGLTENEKQLYRGAGRTSVLQGIKSAQAGITKSAAAQGLKGGSIASILAAEEAKKASGFAGIETNIMATDVATKKQRIADILAFLNLQSGEGYPSDLRDLNMELAIDKSAEETIAKIIADEIAKQKTDMYPTPFPSEGGSSTGDSGYGAGFDL